jgi:glycosyltransferase involved in cell wall biosynthesis
MKVAIAHDYLTQRGGAERVVLAMLKAFPGAPIYTSLYEPSRTFPEFADADVRRTALNRVRALRSNHRNAFPLLAPAMSLLRIEADLVLCSSSGWAHGIATEGRKIVYCHAPARWLYQTERYREGLGTAGLAVLAALRSTLRAWDSRAARSAHRYLANSRHVAAAVQDLYGVDAEVLPPPAAVVPVGSRRPLLGVEPGFFLCVSRLLPYKNVDRVAAAFARLAGERLVVVGRGPDEHRLRTIAPANVRLLPTVEDDQLRWLYANCSAVVAAAYEDFGLTPLEAAGFGKPTAALRFGGFLDTVRDGVNGLYFDEPTPEAIAKALVELRARTWRTDVLRQHAAGFSEERFVERLRRIAAREVAARPLPRAA